MEKNIAICSKKGMQGYRWNYNNVLKQDEV